MTVANITVTLVVNRNSSTYFQLIIDNVLMNFNITYRQPIFLLESQIKLIIWKPNSSDYYGIFRSRFINRLSLKFSYNPEYITIDR